MVPPLSYKPPFDVKPELAPPPAASSAAAAAAASNGVVVILSDDEDEISVVAPSPAAAGAPSGATGTPPKPAASVSGGSGKDGGGDGGDLGGGGGVDEEDADVGDGIATVASTVHLYPHARGDCPGTPFVKAVTAESVISNKKTCAKCFCFACDTEASACTSWAVHCMAYDCPDWRNVRTRKKRGMALQILPSMYLPPSSSSTPGGGSAKQSSAPWRSSAGHGHGGMGAGAGQPSGSADADEEEEAEEYWSAPHYFPGSWMGQPPAKQRSNKELDVEIAKHMPPTNRNYSFSLGPKTALARADPQRGLVGHLDVYLPHCGHWDVTLGRNVVPGTMALVKMHGTSVPSEAEREVLSHLFSCTAWSSDKTRRIRTAWEALSSCVTKSLVAVEWEGPTHAADAVPNPHRLLETSSGHLDSQERQRLYQRISSRHGMCEKHFSSTPRLTKANCCRLRAKVFLLPAAVSTAGDNPQVANDESEEAEDGTDQSTMNVRSALLLADLLNALTLYDPTSAPAPSADGTTPYAAPLAPGEAATADGAAGATSTSAGAAAGAAAAPPAPAAVAAPTAASKRAEEKAAASAARREARKVAAQQRGRMARFEAREAARTKRKEQRAAAAATVASLKAAREASEVARLKELREAEAAEAANMDGLPPGVRVYTRSEVGGAGGDRAAWATVVRADQPARSDADERRLRKEFESGYGERSLMRVANLLRSPQFFVDDGRAAAAQPPDVNVSLRPYQKQSLSWMEECEARRSISDPFWVRLHMTKPAGPGAGVAGGVAGAGAGAGSGAAAGSSAGAGAGALAGSTTGGGLAPGGASTGGTGGASNGTIVPFYYSPWSGHVRSQPPTSTVGGILAEEMGLGKTVELIALVCNSLPVSRAMPIAGGGTATNAVSSRATLIVCPVSLLRQWEAELDRRTTMPPGVPPLNVLRWYGAGRTRDPKLLATYDVVLTTYGVCASSKEGQLSSPLMGVDWFRLCLDECHYIKGGRSSSIFRFLSAVKSRRRWSISGTPVNQKLGDLQPQLDFLGVTPFGTPNVWEGLFARPYSSGQQITASFATKARYGGSGGMLPLYILPSLSYLVKKLAIRHVKEQMLDGEPLVALPVRYSKIVPVTLAADERLLYTALEKHCRASSEPLTTTDKVCRRHYFQLAQNLLPLRLAAAGAATADQLTRALADDPSSGGVNGESTKKGGSAKKQGQSPGAVSGVNATRLRAAAKRLASRTSSKLTRLISDMRSIREDDPVAKFVLFTEFGSLVEPIVKTLSAANLPSVFLAGHMTGPARGKVIDRFTMDPEVVGLVLARRTGAVGLTLTAANHVMLLEPGLNRAVEDQAVGRVHRLGQTRPVHTHTYVAADTVDTRCVELRRRKGEALSSGGDVKTPEQLRAERREARRVRRRERRKELRSVARMERESMRRMRMSWNIPGNGGPSGAPKSESEEEQDEDDTDDESDSDTSADDEEPEPYEDVSVTRCEEWRTLMGMD